MVEMLPRFVVTVEPVRDETINELTTKVDAVIEEALNVDTSAVETFKLDTFRVFD
jgi:hypothetical protein